MSLPWLALGAAFVVNFVVGGAWYGALANPWMRELGFTREQIEKEAWPMPSYAVATVGAAIQALVFALVHTAIAPASALHTLGLGLALGLAAAFATGKHHAFGRKTWTLFAIDGGNDLAGFLAMAAMFAWLAP